MNPCGIVGLAGEILAKRKETGAQQTDTPEDDDGGSDAPTSRPQTRAQPGTEDHHQGREDEKVELLNPAVRAGLQGAHRLSDGIVLAPPEPVLDDESDCEKNRSNHARDRPDRLDLAPAPLARQAWVRGLLCCHAATIGPEGRSTHRDNYSIPGTGVGVSPYA